MKGDYRGVADIIPVDIPVNMIIAAGWYTAVTKPSSCLIYHSTTGSINPFTWGELGMWKSSTPSLCFHTCGVMFSCIRFSFNDFIIGERYFERLMVQGLEKISILVCCPFHHYKYMMEWNAFKTEFFKQNLINTSSWAKMKIKIQTDNIGKWHVAIIWFKIANFC